MSDEAPRKIQIVEDPWATFRHIIEGVAIVAAGLWAFYTFIYQERIKPASEPAALSETISVQRLGRDEKREILGVTFTYRNAGKTEIDIAADAYDIVGIRYGDRAKTFDRRAADRPGSQIRYRRRHPPASRQIFSCAGYAGFRRLGESVS